MSVLWPVSREAKSLRFSIQFTTIVADWLRVITPCSLAKPFPFRGQAVLFMPITQFSEFD